MRKVEVKISEAHYRMLKEIAEKLDLSVEDLIQQELDQALANAEIWLERACA
mgnify:CR=1 FL=1